jgi:pre-60S factor REI1
MKRRVASLPPVSQEIFNEKVLAAKATSSAAAAKASFEKSCSACQKTFYSENSYQNHVKSSKHKAREARMQKDLADDSSSVMSSTFSLGEPINKSQEGDSDVTKVTENLKTSTIEEEDEDEEELEAESEYSPSRCLFCSHKASDLQENTEHMRKSHGMFIPERDYLVNLEGLIHYLYRKINENSECLYCHAIRNSPASIRTHMRDKGHCMIAFETEEEQIEIGQYYDFRSTYSDDEAGSVTSETPEDGGVKVSGSDGDDDGWETETSASSLDEDEDDDDFDSHRKAPVVYQTEYELHLPSGKSVGHRSLAKYYRQNLHNYPSMEERIARQLAIENGEVEEERPRGRNPTRALVTRANGGLGMIGATDDQKRAAAMSERKDRTRAIRQDLRYRDRVNRAANNQKHFRVCTSFPDQLDRKLTLTARTPSCNDRSAGLSFVMVQWPLVLSSRLRGVIQVHAYTWMR